MTINILMTIALIFLMAYQVTRELFHEIFGAAMLIAILITGYSGMAMSRYVFSWLKIGTVLVPARTLHLAGSYWSFVLMSAHIGLHWSMATRVMDQHVKNKALSWTVRIAGIAFAFYGGVCFFRQNILSYMFLRNLFAFLDYDKAAVLVLFENVAMMAFFICIVYYIMRLISMKKKTAESA